MSLLERLRSAITFRTATPAFEPGEEFTAYVTGLYNSGAVVRVGDTVLHLSNGEASLVDTQIRLRVTSFDTSANEGQAELLSVVDDD